MSSVVYDRKVFGAIVFIAEIGESLVQGCIPAIRGDLVELGLEMEFVAEKLPELVDLSVPVELLFLMHTA